MKHLTYTLLATLPSMIWVWANDCELTAEVSE